MPLQIRDAKHEDKHVNTSTVSVIRLGWAKNQCCASTRRDSEVAKMSRSIRRICLLLRS